ncbi:MAG: hypothetical protein PHX74_05970 [Candidatus Sumerlaeales bacterium]|nr:hypothetical protein [Candidatus Sumerlaeales bacterium]
MSAIIMGSISPLAIDRNTNEFYITPIESSEHADEVVFLVHGITRDNTDMARLQQAFHRAGYTVVNWHYPSTQLSIPDIAEEFVAVIGKYAHKKRKLHFVGHSMGGIIIRYALKDYKTDDATLGRLVMIGTPNKGAYLADVLAQTKLYKMLLGPAGQDLRSGDIGMCFRAPQPPLSFGVIAGGTGFPIGMNPMIHGDNDGIVAVSETYLPQMDGFLLLPYLHRFLPLGKRTVEASVRFIQTGQFAE